MIDPFLPCHREFVAICLPNQLLAALVSKFLIDDIVPPDRESSLDIFAAIFDLGGPEGIQGLVLSTEHLIGILLFPAPHVEHS